MQDFNLSPFFGAGLLSVTKYLEDAKQPFTGQVELAYGNIAQDLAYYYLTSEQIHTAFNLSIKFDRNGDVTGAGGLFLQAMPQAGERLAAEVEDRILKFPSLGDVFTDEPGRGDGGAGRLRSVRAQVPRDPPGRIHVPLQPGSPAPHAQHAADR